VEGIRWSVNGRPTDVFRDQFDSPAINRVNAVVAALIRIANIHCRSHSLSTETVPCSSLPDFPCSQPPVHQSFITSARPGTRFILPAARHDFGDDHHRRC
jgi:hypothetical protein